MKHDKLPAATIRAAVTAATAKPCACVGVRIEEILGVEIPYYPDDIRSLDALPKKPMEFVGYCVDFREVVCLQSWSNDQLTIASHDYPLVGWRPARAGEQYEHPATPCIPTYGVTWNTAKARTSPVRHRFKSGRRVSHATFGEGRVVGFWTGGYTFLPDKIKSSCFIEEEDVAAV